LPALAPVTIPVEDPTLAMPLLLLLHTPPEILPVKPVVRPTHTLVVPLITGVVFTVTVNELEQPAAVI